jgi:hypothetical protein
MCLDWTRLEYHQTICLGFCRLSYIRLNYIVTQNYSDFNKVAQNCSEFAQSMITASMLGGSLITTACPQVADKGDSLQIWRVAANILNKLSREANEGWSSRLGVGRRAITGWFGWFIPVAPTWSIGHP